MENAFWGMTHYCVTTLRGKFRVGRKPSRKRMRRTLRRIKEELRRRMHLGKHEVAQWLGRVINGWLNYYAVPGTSKFVDALANAVWWLMLRTLRRRSQKDATAWAEAKRLARMYWPKPTIRHPWPDQRLTVNTQGRSPVR